MFQIEIKNVSKILGHTTISGIANEPTYFGKLSSDDKIIAVESVHSSNMNDLDHVLLEVVSGQITNKDIGLIFYEKK